MSAFVREPGRGVFLSNPPPVKQGWLRHKIMEVRVRRAMGQFVDHGFVGETGEPLIPRVDGVVEDVARQYLEGKQ